MSTSEWVNSVGEEIEKTRQEYLKELNSVDESRSKTTEEIIQKIQQSIQSCVDESEDFYKTKITDRAIANIEKVMKDYFEELKNISGIYPKINSIDLSEEDNSITVNWSYVLK